ncbi:MAG: Coenzyme F420 hydrogenase/dehydrogenase, beta subunit C-terminal domain [Candidatus Borkfalkia sp.]
MRKNINILNRERCTGCRVCENVCPSQAIEFKENKEGFLYPNVKEDLCTNCGFCTQKCPVLTETEYGEIQECYAVMSEKDIRMESSSGGMFTVLANYILKKGGYVCGAAWKSPFTVAHKIIHRNEDLHELQLSKYIQSDLNNCYRQIKDLLAENKAVLFVGCPCQVDGLYHFLGKRDNQNLITADLVCHGVPSYKTLEKYCKEVAGDRQVKQINFRSKEVYKWSTTMKIEFSDGSIYRRGFKEDPWFNCFAENLFFRSSFYACKYAKIPRVGDFIRGLLANMAREPFIR